MKYNIANIILLSVIVIVQFFVPMAEGGRTYFSYIIPWLSVAAKGAFVLKLFGLPVPAKYPIAGELGAYFFTMFFFLSALYRKGFAVYPAGIGINAVCLLMTVAAVMIEDHMFIYEYKEIEASTDD